MTHRILSFCGKGARGNLGDTIPHVSKLLRHTADLDAVIKPAEKAAERFARPPT
jgi:hypothetical protein